MRRAGSWVRTGVLVAMVLLGALFDYRLNWSRTGAAAVLVLGLVPIVLRRALGPTLRRLGEKTGLPAPLRAPLVVGLSVGVVYLTRWRGDQPLFAGLLTIVVPTTIALGLRALPEATTALAGWWELRDRVLPRPLRVVLAVTLPVLVAFVVVHGSLADLPALFGANTTTSVEIRTRTPHVLVGTAAATLLVWLLVQEPRSST